MSKVFVCPKPDAWNRVYEVLLKVWESTERKISKPPIPLILNGWAFTSDEEKHERWKATVNWAENNGYAELIPKLGEDEKYEVDEMTTIAEPWWDDLGKDKTE